MNSRIFKKILGNNTKIVATLGPASDNKQIIWKLIYEGVDIFRLNFSHGTYNNHQNIINIIKQINVKYNLNISIIIDLQGPKIRVDTLKNHFIELKKNQVLEIVPKSIQGDNQRISISYKSLYKFIKPGQKILLDDGKIGLSVQSIKNKVIFTKVINSGLLKSKKGVNLPQAHLNIPSLTIKDKNDIKFGLKNNIHVFALSFVREKNDIINLKKYIRQFTNNTVTIIAKIEKPQAVKNIHGIIHEADGIMVARGDLGVELSPEKIPLIQKKLISIANKHHKFVITATQMLESMIESPVPTRAETTDVFNAVIDGTDAVMLSGETAMGSYPLNAVQIMNKILKNAENYIKGKKCSLNNSNNLNNRTLIAQSLFTISKSIKPKFIISFSNSGKTAQILSKTKPASKIITFTPDKKLLNRLSFYYGVFPFVLKKMKYAAIMFAKSKEFLLKHKLVKKDDKILISIGVPLTDQPETNSLIIYTI